MSKYGNRKTMMCGKVFDSKREAERFLVLLEREQRGEIQDLHTQVPFIIIPAIGKQREAKYIADFVYIEKGKKVVEDAKGVRTAEYKLKRKLMYHLYGIQIREV